MYSSFQFLAFIYNYTCIYIYMKLFQSEHAINAEWRWQRFIHCILRTKIRSFIVTREKISPPTPNSHVIICLVDKILHFYGRPNQMFKILGRIQNPRKKNVSIFHKIWIVSGSSIGYEKVYMFYSKISKNPQGLGPCTSCMQSSYSSMTSLKIHFKK